MSAAKKIICFILVLINHKISFGQTSDSLVIPVQEEETRRKIIRQNYEPVEIDFNILTEKDTIYINASILDCNDLSYHNEFITIYKKEASFYAALKESPCTDPLSSPARQFEPVELTTATTQLFQQFIQDFNDLGLFLDGTSRSSFLITFQNRNYFRRYPEGIWKQYINLRDKIFIELKIEFISK